MHHSRSSGTIRQLKKRTIDQRLADAHITPLWYPEGEHNHVEEIL